jgi:hypothetical protein
VPNPAGSFQQRPIGEDLDRGLTVQGTVVVTQVLSGLGGVGKTQLAAATVRQLVARGAVDDVVWVSAATGDAIVSTLAEAASVLIQAPTDDPTAAARRLLSWLATTDRRWMIVFDDLADPNDLDGWWPPPSLSGRVLVTTRRRDAALLGKGRLVQVDQFSTAEAHSYLADVLAGHPRRLFEADNLARDLGHLPVALAQAAAYIIDRDLTCAQYRQRFATHPLAALAPSAWPDEYARPVAVTLDLAVESAYALAPVGLARPLLLLLSLLDPNGIPEQIIASDAVLAHLSPRAGFPVDAEQARDALTCLARLNLADIVRPSIADDAGADDRVRVHALLQRAARDHAAFDVRGMAARACADALLTVWPEVERDLDLVQLFTCQHHRPAHLRRGSSMDARRPRLVVPHGEQPRRRWFGASGTHIFRPAHSRRTDPARPRPPQHPRRPRRPGPLARRGRRSSQRRRLRAAPHRLPAGARPRPPRHPVQPTTTRRLSRAGRGRG